MRGIDISEKSCLINSKAFYKNGFNQNFRVKAMDAIPLLKEYYYILTYPAIPKEIRGWSSKMVTCNNENRRNTHD